MSSRAFLVAEQARRRFKPVSAPQRGTLARYSRMAGIELPIVRTSTQASDAISRLEKIVRQPTLGPMG